MKHTPDRDEVVISNIIQRHEELEIEHGDGDAGNFLFGWQCKNPYADELLTAVKKRTEAIDHVKYIYVEDDLKLTQKVLDLQFSLDAIMPNEVFCAPGGAVSILFAFCAFLSKKGVKEVYFIPPIYYSMHIALKLFNIRARAVSGLQAFESSFSMNLPDKKTILILADPIWYVGLSVPESIVSEIREWQEKTQSLVFVDGSFQYMRWNEDVYEATSKLDPERTFRLISPTKSLGVHGYRFAYSLLPAMLKSEFSNTYTNIYGSTAADNWAFAYEATTAMKNRTLTTMLVRLAKERHKRLRRKGAISSQLNPECGYFAFEKINVTLPEGYLMMTGDYFDQHRFPGHARLNLISPSFALLDHVLNE
jgi:aspartate/methionine/tyrosine aminotransferase